MNSQLEHPEIAKIKRLPKLSNYRVQQTVVNVLETEAYTQEEAIEAFEAALDNDTLELKKTQLAVTNLDV